MSEQMKFFLTGLLFTTTTLISALINYYYRQKIEANDAELAKAQLELEKTREQLWQARRFIAEHSGPGHHDLAIYRKETYDNPNPLVCLPLPGDEPESTAH